MNVQFSSLKSEVYFSCVIDGIHVTHLEVYPTRENCQTVLVDHKSDAGPLQLKCTLSVVTSLPGMPMEDSIFCSLLSMTEASFLRMWD